MLKIGDFSKLAQVSVKALRHYGRLGLLKPAWIDRFTGYRYYTVDQLPRLNRILALKDLGFSLEQIQQLLRDGLPAAELRGMMRIKHAELEQRVQAEQSRLARIGERLRQIEQEGTLPEYEVVLKQVPPQRVVGIRDVIPGYSAVASLFEELREYLRLHKVTPAATDPYIAIYYDAEYRENGADAEAAAPLSKPLPDTSRVVVHNLPGVDAMACVIHQGGSDSLSRAYRSLVAWIETNGYRVIGPNRDVYLRWMNGVQSAANVVTEVQFPVERRPVFSLSTQPKEKGEMEPKIVTIPAFTVVGMLYHGKNENNEIAQMWQKFNPRADEIQNKVDKDVAYGVCGELQEDGSFKYVAGYEVDSMADIPEGMVSWEVPGQKYAIFPCTLKAIGEAYEYAFKTWMPQSRHQHAGGPDFEYYGEDFDPEVEGSQLHVYIPVK